jgi:Immunity protein 30
MTNESYDMQLSALRQEIEDNDGQPAIVDKAVAVILESGRESAVSDFLSLLSDDVKYDEGMFSVIHAAESFEDSTYVKSLLFSFSRLSSKSPRWASIVLMRALNSASTQREIVSQLREAAPEIKNSLREMCKLINEVSPQFLSKTTPVLIAAH